MLKGVIKNRLVKGMAEESRMKNKIDLISHLKLSNKLTNTK